jgi:hypothetical protein
MFLQTISYHLFKVRTRYLPKICSKEGFKTRHSLMYSSRMGLTTMTSTKDFWSWCVLIKPLTKFKPNFTLWLTLVTLFFKLWRRTVNLKSCRTYSTRWEAPSTITMLRVFWLTTKENPKASQKHLRTSFMTRMNISRQYQLRTRTPMTLREVSLNIFYIISILLQISGTSITNWSQWYQ